MMREREVGCAEYYADCDATCAEGGECFEGFHELVGNTFLGCNAKVCGSKRRLRDVRMKNAILKGKNRITPSRRFVEGISKPEERVVDGRSDTLV